MTVRVGTYNLHGLRDSLPALTRVMAAARADVLCVQEAPRFGRWRARRAALAAAAGLAVATPDRAGGVAVLVGRRARVLHAESHRLRAFLGLERRALAVAVVQAEGARLAVGSLHLDLSDPARMHHAAEAVALMEGVAARHGAVVLLAGDVNEHPHRPAWRYLAGRLADCHAAAPEGDGLTFPAARPSARIDGVFAARGTHVVSCGGVDASIADLTGASDHLPVVAELRVGH
ncbi:endonuclease/exonuclease/phosphatase family metal-dependent hydrolase [Nonomuraea thailandensis]|uniref:Endonuclease/exonuclease/phosphatase family metal-dependent hydrolase n=1 Tax=Nonomuraea thailandensis TaxID=1188745 RepID=A0A9X2K7B0_9ACTN|nr:endonuclease/exonuclease/phosphatase family protein [Nonomuraea thailandensis]MCP2359606.1 endonuclease/exonuclease/phosphatase family metal-dependent hydrolase [Nonomuraea thailandensis]